jgi:hypothetical protein
MSCPSWVQGHRLALVGCVAAALFAAFVAVEPEREGKRQSSGCVWLMLQHLPFKSNSLKELGVS